MTNFYNELSSKIVKNKKYVLACDNLFQAYIFKMVNEEYKLEDQTIKKLTTTIQYLYKSESEEFQREGAILLSMLLEVAGEQTPELISIAKHIYTQSGDFPNVKLLANKFQKSEFRLNFFNETSSILREDLNTVDEIEHPLTDYQRTLWEDLSSEEDVITSAPTSTGKTDIILRYLIQKLIDSDQAFAVVVVPTRALISEIASKIYNLALEKSFEKNIDICTVPKDGPFQDRTFFVMTQERLFEILQHGDLSFDYLFIDEAHNISDKGRGVLLHLTLEKLLEDSFPQIIISMPSPLYQNAFDSVFENIEFLKNITKTSPVAKIIMSVSLKGTKINISRLGSGKIVTIDKNFREKNVAKIAHRLGQREINIVYQNRTDYCENVANKIAELITEECERPSLQVAADYIEQFVHKDFTLASNLRKGIAFHYGPLPGVIRKMIEDLVRNGDANFVVCTSTLAEGINLPAKNLFLKNPTQQTPRGQKSTKLEKVVFDNITGRAGRMLNHFSGNIFLIEHAEWDYQDYFEEPEEKIDKIPTFFQVINEDMDGVINALQGEFDLNNNNHYSYYTIANKLLKAFDGDNLSTTFNSKDLKLNKKEKRRLEKKIKQAYGGLKVDTYTLEANPTVGFIQQNKLYNIISRKKNLKDWTLPHPKSSLLYSRLDKVCRLLFDVGIFLPKDNRVGQAVTIAKKWITGESLKKIIIQQIIHESNNGEKYNCNRSVRNVITVINTDVRFKMSSALRCYHSLITNIISDANIDSESQRIHSFIEVGGCDSRIIDLVGLGLSRETALEINRILDQKIEIKSFEALKKVYADKKLGELHIITKKEIENLLM